MAAGEQTASLSIDDYEVEGEESGPGTYFLGRYRVVDEIGVGGMASVHLARADGAGGFQKWVAIKRIHPHLVEDDQFIHMFLDEARIAARIDHSNVAQVFDLGEGEGTYWIAMEYLHGEPLREILRCAEDGSQPRLSYALAAKIIADAGDGLHAAHDLRGKNNEPLELVHRDVTPHNLFVTYSGTTKVVDFGIAKVAGRLSNTRAGTLKGKLAYMSPEQVGGHDVDRGTDIFALGVVLWEVTTGQRLFRMDSDLETLDRVQRCVVPLPSSIHADYPRELEGIVMKALAKNRSQRFATAREMSRALQQFIVRGGGFVGPEDVAEYLQRILGDRIRKRDEHLRWAAEVTQTRAGGGRPDVVLGTDAEVSLESYHSEVRAPRPAAGNRVREVGVETRFEGTPSVSSVASPSAAAWGPPASYERPTSGAVLSPPHSYTPPSPHGAPPGQQRLPGAPLSSPPGALPPPAPRPSVLPPPRSPSAAPGTYGMLPPVSGPHGGLPPVSVPYGAASGALPPMSSPSLPANRGYGTPLPPQASALPSFGEPDPDDDLDEDVHTIIHMAPPSASMNIHNLGVGSSDGGGGFGLIDDEAKTTAVIASAPSSAHGFATPLPAAGNRARPAPTPAPAPEPVHEIEDPSTRIGRPYGDEDADAKSEATRAGPMPTPSGAIAPVPAAAGESSVLTPAGPVALPTAPLSEGIGTPPPPMQMAPMPPMQAMQPMDAQMHAMSAHMQAMSGQPVTPAMQGMQATQPAPLAAPAAAAAPTNKPAALMAVIAVAAVVVAAGVMFLVFQKSRPAPPTGAPMATTVAATAPPAPAPTPEPTATASPFSVPETTPPPTPPPVEETGAAGKTGASTATPETTKGGGVKPSAPPPPPPPTPGTGGRPPTPTAVVAPPPPPAPPKPAETGGDTGTLVVRCDPACESVQANSRSLGPSPVNTKLPPGTYTIRLRRSGAAPKSVSTTIVAGKTARVQVDMK